MSEQSVSGIERRLGSQSDDFGNQISLFEFAAAVGTQLDYLFGTSDVPDLYLFPRIITYYTAHEIQSRYGLKNIITPFQQVSDDQSVHADTDQDGDAR